MPPIAAMIADPRLAAEPAAAVVRQSMRMFWIALGVFLLVVGAVGAVLPGHLGLPLLVLGLIIVLRNSRAARKTFVRTQHKHPNMVYPVRRVLRRWQDIVPVLWHQMLKSERFFLRRFHVLRRCRRAVFRRAR